MRNRIMGEFTLVELLVVIAVIGILTSLLLPALAMGRERARGLVCQGNLKQIGMSVLMYANDHDDMIPSVFSWSNDLPAYLVPMTTARMTVWTCPKLFSQNKYIFTYGMNGDATSWQTGGVKLSTWFRNPSNTILFKDGGTETGEFPGWYSLSVQYATGCLGSISLHCGGANYLFVDNHVKALRPGEVSSSMWHK